MKITGYGNASVKIEMQGQVFFFDPYNKDLVEVKETGEQRKRREAAFEEARKIFITHGHFDHLGSIASLYRNKDVKIYCTATPAETLKKQGFPAENIDQISQNQKLTFGAVTLSCYPTGHCRFNAGEIKNVLLHHHPAGRLRQLFKLLWLHIAVYPSGKECLLYELSDGSRRIQLLGSAGLNPGTDYPTGADVLILPYQGRSDMDVYCMKLVERLKPGKVYLDHYDDAFPPLTCREDTDSFMERMSRAHPEIFCGLLKEAETIEL